MSDLHADPLSPLDAATLWPQMRRLATEVVATRSGENLFLSSGLAAVGLTHLPRMPRTAVLGVKRGLGYRSVLIERELDGGAGWEIVSVRIARETDGEAVTAVLASASVEAAQRGGRMIYLRYADGSPHAAAILRGGLVPYGEEHLFVLPDGRRAAAPTLFRPAERSDRHGIFRLYCRAVPEAIRRNEAPTQQEWRAVLDSYGCDRQYVFEHEGAILAWVGIGDREARLMVYGPAEGALDGALDLVETQSSPEAAIIISGFQEDVAQRALERGYLPLGTRVCSSRRIAVLTSLKEGASVRVKETLATPQ